MVAVGKKQHAEFLNWDGITDQWAYLLGERSGNFRSEHLASWNALPEERREQLTGIRRGKPRGMSLENAIRIKEGAR